MTELLNDTKEHLLSSLLLRNLGYYHLKERGVIKVMARREARN